MSAPPEMPKYVRDWMNQYVELHDGRTGIVTSVTMGRALGPESKRVIRVRVAIDNGPLWHGTTYDLTRKEHGEKAG